MPSSSSSSPQTFTVFISYLLNMCAWVNECLCLYVLNGMCVYVNTLLVDRITKILEKRWNKNLCHEVWFRVCMCVFVCFINLTLECGCWWLKMYDKKDVTVTDWVSEYLSKRHSCFWFYAINMRWHFIIKMQAKSSVYLLSGLLMLYVLSIIKFSMQIKIFKNTISRSCVQMYVGAFNINISSFLFCSSASVC